MRNSFVPPRTQRAAESRDVGAAVSYAATIGVQRRIVRTCETSSSYLQYRIAYWFQHLDLIYLSTCLSIYLSTYLSIYLSICEAAEVEVEVPAELRDAWPELTGGMHLERYRRRTDR